MLSVDHIVLLLINWPLHAEVYARVSSMTSHQVVAIVFFFFWKYDDNLLAKFSCCEFYDVHFQFSIISDFKLAFIR